MPARPRPFHPTFPGPRLSFPAFLAEAIERGDYIPAFPLLPNHNVIRWVPGSCLRSRIALGRFFPLSFFCQKADPANLVHLRPEVCRVARVAADEPSRPR